MENIDYRFETGTMIFTGYSRERLEDHARDEYLFEVNRALRQIGRGLHPVQDVHAHGEMGNSLIGHHVYDTRTMVTTSLSPMDRFGIMMTDPIPLRAFFPFDVRSVPGNIPRADDPTFDWFRQTERIRLVPVSNPVNDRGFGQRYLDTREATEQFLESFLVQSGLRTCTRLREDQRVWSNTGASNNSASTGAGAGGTTNSNTNSVSNGNGSNCGRTNIIDACYGANIW